MTTFTNDFSEKLGAFNSSPILFVGAGLSKRYLNMPSWEPLLKDLAKLSGKDFEYYRSSANGDYSMLASLMVEDAHQALWSDANSELRDRYMEHTKYKASALKIFTANFVTQLQITDDPHLLEEIELLKLAEIDGIITTNYDGFLEQLFPDYKVFVGQDELLLSDPQGIGEIYKIHGSVEKPNSIVITSEDYADYKKRNVYLAAKLMTFFAEHPIIFAGYSLSDDNIIGMIDSLVKCVKTEHISLLQDRLFVVKWVEDVQPSITPSVVNTMGVTIPVNIVTVPNYIELYSVLGGLKRKFPAHLLRRLKERVYELVLHNDPEGKLYVEDIDAKDQSKVDVVFGVGAIDSLGAQGYVGLTRLNLCDDVLTPKEKEFKPDAVILQALPRILSMPGNVPFIKYMIKGGFADVDGKLLRGEELNPKVRQRFEDGAKNLIPPLSVQKKAKELAQQEGNFTNLVANNDPDTVFLALGALKPENVKTEELRAFLIQQRDNYVSKNGTIGTGWAKAIALYDRLLYLKQPW